MITQWNTPGAVREWKELENGIELQTEECTIQLHILAADLIQVKMVRPGEKVRDSIAIYKKDWPVVDFRVEDQQSQLKVETDKLHLQIAFDPYQLVVADKTGEVILADYAEQGLNFSEDGKVRSVNKLTETEKFYGLGERTGFLNKRGEVHELWNFDQGNPHIHSTKHLYKTIPFLLGMKADKAYGIFFDNTFCSRFDLGKESENYFYFEADGGSLNYYIVYGPDFKSIIRRYTELTGRIELPPLWSLGFHQSRYSYYPEERVRGLAEEFREKKFPCDVIHLDIDYMDGYRVFTWDEERFPNFTAMLSDLKENGFKVVTIVDPGVKKDNQYPMYREGLEHGYFCTDSYGVPYIGKVWPGESLFPDFAQSQVRNWWAQKNREWAKLGVTGIWNDMNEPALFEVEGQTLPSNVLHQHDEGEMTHAEFHNLYGTYMGMATKQGLKEARPNERPFILTRAAYAGIQRFAAVWTGDNRSYWEHLSMSIPMLCTLGLSGVTFAGSDVGGFGWDASPELFARWVQLGSLYPFCRVHSAIDAAEQEPWSFGEQVEQIGKEYVSLRYRLLNHIYNLFYRSSLTGEPVFRPLIFDYQEDAKVYNLNDQFLLGDSMLIAPVLQPGKDCREVYLPVGQWYDFHTDEIYSGGRSILADAPIEKMPIFIKASSILPMIPVQNYVGEQQIEELTLNIYPGEESADYLYYEDDGQSFDYQNGEYNLTNFKVEFRSDGADVTLTPKIQKYASKLKTYHMIFKGMAEKSQIRINGKEALGKIMANDFIVDISPIID